MTLTALLVCADQAAAQVLRQVLEELHIQVEACGDFPRAQMRLAQQRFDVVVVDGPSNSEVIQLLRDTRLSRVNDATLAVAVVEGQETIREIFSLGVNFVLYKPIAYERALSSLRAARAVMRKEKRKSARATVHAHATVDYANVQQEKATLVDLARDGMSVRLGKKIPPSGKVYFQFQLPGQKSSVRLSGQVIWQEWGGRAGIQFVDVPKTSRRMIDEYLSANVRNDSSRESFADVAVNDVAVEMELPGLPASDMAAAAKAGASGSSEGGESVTQSAYGSVAAVAEADNRRSQARLSCRIGAEVYRTGVSVPNHCCLTDLSAGGCYLEVSLPFPIGSTVEIVVRAKELKLHLRGTVQASHPGYGMGVAFELKTKQDQENARKLNEFVAMAN